MDIRPVAPIRHALRDVHVRVPASKSVANRELVLSALADGRSRLELGELDPGDDVHAMADAIAAFGHEVRWTDGQIEVVPRQVPYAHATIDARDAGTVARFCAALAALASSETTVDGSERMRQRPMRALARALRSLGVEVTGETLPLRIRGPLAGGSVDVPGYESSQFASALLLVAPRTRDGLRLRLLGEIVSAPFLDLTIACLQGRGVRVTRAGRDEFSVAAQRVKARSLRIPGDVTASTYPAAAVALLGGTLTIGGVSARNARGGQGDARFYELIEQMGCVVSHGGSAVTVNRTGPLHGITANVSDCSDVFPTLAIVATQADSATELDGLAHTRGQESDRIAAVADAINVLGGRARSYADGIRIEPVPLRDGIVDARGDHRIAMAFSILGLLVPGVAVDGWRSVTKTFPAFYDMLRELGR